MPQYGAEVYSTQITKLTATPARKLDQSEGPHWPLSLYGEYEASAIVSPRTIRMVRVPSGYRIVDGWCFWDSMSNGFITVGDDDDTDRYMLSKDVDGTVGSERFDSIAGLGFVTTTETYVSIYVDQDASAGAAASLTGTLRVLVYAIPSGGS